MLDRVQNRNVHGRRNDVITRLAHVDMIVGMNRLLVSHVATEHLDRAIANDLIGIHVR